MGFLGSPEVAALSWNSKKTTISGVRIKASSRGGYETVAYAQSFHSDWQRAADAVCKELNLNSSVYIVLIMELDGCEVFECNLPASSIEVMREALRFEVARQLLSVPEDFRLQFVQSGGEQPDGTVKVRCAVFPESSLHKLSNQVTALARRPDAVINPLLTLPGELPADAAVLLDGNTDDFCWQNGSRQLPEDDCNKVLDDTLSRLCAENPSTEWLDMYRTALCGAIFAERKLFCRNNILAGVTILPAFLRPARYRTQLRLMAMLAVLLIGVNVFRYAGSFFSDYSEYRKLSARVVNQRAKVQDMRKKLKTGEKQLKELQRMAELKLGSRECMGYLGYLSEKLPGDVWLSNFRWNEGSVDLNMQTTSPDLDLVSFFNRLAGFKVLSASQRSNPMNTFTTANVKLSIIEPPLPVVGQAGKKSRAKSKK